MTRHRIAITPGLGAHKLVLDGRDISRGIQSLTMRLDAGNIPDIELELAFVDIDRIEAEEAEVHIPEAAREALIALGWTPPADGEQTGGNRD